MSRLLRTAVFGLASAIGAAVLLLAGLVATEGFWHARHHHYTKRPWGVFRESLNGRVMYWPENDAADVVSLTFQFEGKTATRWHWNSDSPRYSQLTLTWSEETPTSLGGSVRLLLPSMRFENEQTNGVLTREALALWLVDHNRRAATHPEIAAVAGEVYRVLQSAGDGSLPSPNHHGHTIEQAGRRIGNFMHGRPGFGLSIPGWLWVLAWPFACYAGFCWIQRRLLRPNSPT